MKQINNIKSLSVSDLHMLTDVFQAEKFLDLLKSFERENEDGSTYYCL